MAKTKGENRPRGSKFTPNPPENYIGPFAWRDTSKWEAGIQPTTAKIAAQRSIKSPGAPKQAKVVTQRNQKKANIMTAGQKGRQSVQRAQLAIDANKKPRPKGGAFGGH